MKDVKYCETHDRHYVKSCELCTVENEYSAVIVWTIIGIIGISLSLYLARFAGRF